MKTPAEQTLADTFAAAKPKLPGKGEIASLREDAFHRFDAQGLPHRRIEEWKYTDLRALMREAMPLAGAPDQAAKSRGKDAGRILAGVDCRRLVFVDGAFVPELSDLEAEKGLIIGSMADALAKGEAVVTAHVGKVIETDNVALALNTALMGDGIVIAIAAGTDLARPIHLVFAGSGKPAATFTRSLIIVGSGAKATIVESHEAPESQVNAALELVVADQAQVEHLKIASAPALHVSSLLAQVGGKARFNSFTFTVGGAVVRNQLFIRFDGEGTKAGIGGASLLRGREHVDTTMVVDHAAGGCESREQFRAVLDGESRGVFQGKITVRPHAQKTDAKLLTKALLLSETAEADNKPELEIFADDVQCGHGATAGALDEDLLFYLRARGIPLAEAEALLIQAFIGEAVETVGHEGIRDALMGAAVQWLGARK